MKKVMLSLAVIALMGFTACSNAGSSQEGATETTAVAATDGPASISFGVRGNCKMCKAKIEKAAKGVDGVAEANWDVDLKKIAVTYEGSKTDETAIHNAIAAVGYDTDQVTADAKVYEGLHGCCQYDRDMKMSLNTPASN